MPSIKPFAGLRYDTGKVNAGRVVAPPYDVIDERYREALYRRDPRNVVRLILGKEDDPYSEAAREAARWIAEGVLVREAVPAVYFLEQAFSLPGGRMRRRSGFIAACLLEDSGGSVLPHEKTHAGPKDDRLRLMRSTGMMFSQVMALYDDPGRVLDPLYEDVESSVPAMEVLLDGVVNRLRVCTDGAIAMTLAEFLRDRNVLIADGHHRYESALAFRNGMRLNNPAHDGHEPYNFVPMYFSNQAEPGLVIQPTHRLLRGVEGFESASFIAAARRYFSVAAQPSPEAMVERLESGQGREIGILFPSDGGCFILRAAPGALGLIDHLPPVVSRLDVVLLHTAVLGAIVGLTEESQDGRRNIDFERDVPEIVRMMRAGQGYQAAFLLKAPPIAHVRGAAEAGRVLPQKTTYFYPKLLSGMVACILDEGARR